MGLRHTYIETSKGWVYLTVIIDLFVRKVIGWSLSNDTTAEKKVIKACYAAVANKSINQKLIFHPDRGSQYACNTFKNILKSYNVTVAKALVAWGTVMIMLSQKAYLKV